MKIGSGTMGKNMHRESRPNWLEISLVGDIGFESIGIWF
jgi:hypothetical protein